MVVERESHSLKLTKENKQGLGFLIDAKDDDKTIYISNVFVGGIAEKSNLLPNDEVVTVDGKEFLDVNQLRSYLTNIADGQTVAIQITRNITNGVNSNGIHPNGLQSNGVSNGNHADTGLKENAKIIQKSNGCPFSNGYLEAQIRKPVIVKNLLDSSETVDTLHQKAEIGLCIPTQCKGSFYMPAKPGDRANGEIRSKEETKRQAIDFLNQYYASTKSENSPEHKQREESVLRDIDSKGWYDLDEKELSFGARMAWRNAARCIGRIQWKKLQIFDCRHVKTASEMFHCLLEHIQYATNEGKLRSTITIFPQRKEKGKDFRVWNAQLVRYAGYQQPDGTVVGDPASVEITEIAKTLGWKGQGTPFDILPLILQANGEYPELFEIPPEYILQVEIKHPNYPQLDSMGLKWYALPAVANMLFDCGGIEFTASPFNGWYMATEIGARNFSDTSRYNLLKPIAKLMNIDTSNNATLWKDRAMIELTFATLHSFNSAGVTIADHYASSESFMTHFKEEVKLRGGCPADWVWIVPPISGSATPVFHQEMLRYDLKPSYEYQSDPWRTFDLRSKDGSSPRLRRNFREVAKAVKFSAKLMVGALAKRHKVTILYATETGKSEGFANILHQLFLNAFDPKVIRMDDYSFKELENEECVIFVVSTFGNGEAPDNGKTFSSKLTELQESNDGNTSDMLSNLRYSVFGLGSRAYPHFCAFGHFIDDTIKSMGSEVMCPMGEGDELCGQEDSFKEWASKCFEAACSTFCIRTVDVAAVCKKVLNTSDEIKLDDFRIVANDKNMPNDLCEDLSTLHKQTVRNCSIIKVENLQNPNSLRVTDLICIQNLQPEIMKYNPGDHLLIYPRNETELVDKLLKRIDCKFDKNQVIDVQKKQNDEWELFSKLPFPSTLNTIFTSYLDITTPPSIKLLNVLCEHCSDIVEKTTLLSIIEDHYDDWKFQNYPNIVEVLEEFPSIKIDVILLLNLLPVLNPRHYSISSSQSLHPDEIHLTVALVQYNLKDGKEHRGVCSSWLHSLKKGDLIPCVLKSAPRFHMPKDANEPIIMVGPGTGIAPFRSFWQHLEYMKTTQESFNKKVLLFFGCRNPSMDDIYRQELEDCVSKGTITDVFKAYSRHPGQPKKYVQKILEENAEYVCELICEKNAHLYVCGDVTMASDVTKTITTMLQDYLALTDDEVRMFVKDLKTSNYYHEDVFGVTLKVPEVTLKVRKASQRRSKRNHSSGRYPSVS